MVRSWWLWRSGRQAARRAEVVEDAAAAVAEPGVAEPGAAVVAQAVVDAVRERLLRQKSRTKRRKKSR